jgi:hypothetical protein
MILIYSEPTGDGIKRRQRPLLASWDSSDSSAQQGLHAYLDELGAATASLLKQPSGPVALRLDVGMDDPLSLERTDATSTTTCSPSSTGLASPDSSPCGPEAPCGVTASAGGRAGATDHLADRLDTPRGGLRTARQESASWTADVARRLAPVTLPAGPLELQVAYRLHRERNCASLWKPTIDSLGSLLGEGHRPYHPQDDRIGRLGLHRTIDESVKGALRTSWGLRPLAPGGVECVRRSGRRPGAGRGSPYRHTDSYPLSSLCRAGSRKTPVPPARLVSAGFSA